MIRKQATRQIVMQLIFLFCYQASPEAASIAQTRHNLSASGTGAVKATVEKPLCEFCHIPHRSGQVTPLWNKDIREILYTTYQSSTLKAAVGQPNGVSKLCLSCHDGTIALGLLRSESQPLPFTGGVTTMPSGKTRLGTDLSDDHPISFVYDGSLVARDGQLESPANLQRSVKLDRFGQVQCTSCHNPHDDRYGKFLVMENSYSALCTACHKKAYWSASAHRSSPATWNQAAPNPWPHTSYGNVAQNGCENCHQPHSAGGNERLLNYAMEEENCYPCHNGNVAKQNVKREFDKPSRHPVADTRGVHQPTEDLVWAARHVECADCHNPHAANASGKLAGVPGISSAGAAVNPLTFEYELCFRCHGDNPGTRAPSVNRQIFESNFRRKFLPSNASYHPVAAVGKNPSGPSLVSPYTTSSIISCTDCHNSESGPKAGGIGPNGPHGSNWQPLLERQLITSDLTSESSQTYALCYKCHNRTSILSNQSFRYHRLHIVEKQSPCTACHDPHGVSTQAHLINFDKTIVFPSSQGIIRYESTGSNAGSCYLRCHGEDHNPERYSLN